jgi:Gametolysin peptidase M11
MIYQRTMSLLLVLNGLLLHAAYVAGQTTGSIAGTTTNLRGGGVNRRSLYSDTDDSILCRVTMFHTMYVTEDNNTSTKEQPTCIPIVDERETELDFPIDLPLDLLEQYKADIEQGKLMVSISPAQLVDEKLVIGDKPLFTVVTDPRLRHLQERHLQVNTTMTVAVIRISTTDSSPKDSATTLQSTLFGSSFNFPSQYEACSFGKLKWKLADAGVLDITLPNSVTEFATSTDLVTAAQQFLKAQMQISEVSSLADKIVMCLPPGTGDWAASAGVGHWRAQFNSDWCTSLSGTMHELGHTLGLLHSNAADGTLYADRSGYMGSGYTNATWPRKCFNGYNSWVLGWYSDRHLSFNALTDEGRLIKLATFVDYDKAAVDEYVVVNVADNLYLQYNIAKGFNVDTEQKQNQVTITEPASQGTNSLAGLSAGDQFEISNFNSSGTTLIIEACQTMDGSAGTNADVMLISVAMGKSLCGTALPQSSTVTAQAPGNSGRSAFLAWVQKIMASVKTSVGSA